MALMVRLVRLTMGLALLAATAAAEPSYEWGHPRPQGNPVFGLAFTDAQHGWSVCGGGTILQTVDGGEHWQVQHGLGEVAPDLFDIVAAPTGTLIAVGTGIHRSADGGVTWSTVAAPGTDDLRDLDLIPGGGLSAAGAGGVVLISSDDGQSWQEAGPHAGVIRHHLWLSATEGYAVGGAVAHRTVNGGADWAQFIPFGSFGYNEVYFTTPDSGFVVEDFGTWTTVDGGATWTEHFAPVPPLYRYRTLVLSPQHWLAVCNGEGAELWETDNAGASWTERLNRSTVGFPCLVRTSAGRVVCGSTAGDLYWTDDLGQTMTNAATNLCDAAVSAYILSFARRPDGVLFAANQPSTGSDVQSWLRSDDNGRTWYAPPAAPGLRWVSHVAFLDDEHGVAVSYGDVRFTGDGGGSWSSATLPGTYRAARVALPAVERYFVAAYQGSGGGGLLRSVDGGLTWNPVAGGLPAGGISYWDVTFVTPLIGYAAGGTTAGGAALFATTDGGVTWLAKAAVGLPVTVTRLAWLDPLVGIAAARNGAIAGLFRTVDGGQHWNQVLAASISSIAMQPDGRGVATALGGNVYYHSDDAGQTWQPLTAPLSGPFPGQHDSPSIALSLSPGWLLGASGNRILRLEDPAASAVAGPGEPEPAATPVVGRVTRVYPNPFNPAVTLQYTLRADGPVHLAIFDAAGRRVRTLVAATQQAGEHSVVWDGRSDSGRIIAGGVYFYRLVSGGVADGGKLVMAK